MAEVVVMARRLPERYKSFTLAGITDHGSFSIVQEYLRELRKNVKAGVGLALLGSNGVGKTGALAVAHQTVYPELGAKGCMWCRARDIAMSYGYFRVDDTFGEEVDVLYNNARWLVVDELGRETDIKNADRRMHALLSARRDGNRVTCFTSNLSLAKIESTYGKGFHSMLHETCFIAEVGGVDRRRTT